MKIWDAKTGKPERLFTDSFSDEITAICFDKTQRRVIAGDGAGDIKIFDSVTGTCVHQLERLSDEIVFLQYNPIDKTILVVTRAREIRIYKDFKRTTQGERELVKLIKQAHKKEISAADYHLELNMVATGSFDGSIRLW